MVRVIGWMERNGKGVYEKEGRSNNDRKERIEKGPDVMTYFVW